DELVRLRDPDRLTASLEPVVEDDRSGFPTLADASTVADHEALAKTDSAFAILRRNGQLVERCVNRPRAGEKIGMRLAGVDHRFELRVRQEIEDVRRQRRAIAWLRRGDARHGG